MGMFRSRGRAGAAAHGAGIPIADAAAISDKQPSRTRVLGATASGFRGESVEVTGRVDDGRSHGLAGLRVDIYLARREDEGDFARLVGHAVSDDRGRFVAQVSLPRDLELTAYEVFAATPGDRTWQPSNSR
jgi:hypothetical protein